MSYYTEYLNLIFMVKILFILLAITNIILHIWYKSNPQLDKRIVFWKERFEFIFTSLMAGLIIYVCFPPFNKSVSVSGESKLLLYMFGVVLLITAKWDIFFKESKVFRYVQYIAGSTNTNKIHEPKK